jgi:hypothetical protein
MEEDLNVAGLPLVQVKCSCSMSASEAKGAPDAFWHIRQWQMLVLVGGADNAKRTAPHWQPPVRFAMDQNASAGSAIMVSAPVVMRFRCAALSGRTRSMKNLPVTSFAFMRSSLPFAPFLSFSCAALAICAHM